MVSASLLLGFRDGRRSTAGGLHRKLAGYASQRRGSEVWGVSGVWVKRPLKKGQGGTKGSLKYCNKREVEELKVKWGRYSERESCT
ncbi:hypothetical protein E2C01_065080 [Portunus trituberculatus]|uniref:Uncharacterized protein n=1 Tax=Portunus trituberculatus TaxID=210409 RepID=A0A5B7HEQ4_PORTR|nr:hypothetical protein [Portunus trituberculatus]